MVLQKGKLYLKKQEQFIQTEEKLKESPPKQDQLENELLEIEAVFGSLRALLDRLGTIYGID